MIITTGNINIERIYFLLMGRTYIIVENYGHRDVYEIFHCLPRR